MENKKCYYCNNTAEEKSTICNACAKAFNANVRECREMRDLKVAVQYGNMIHSVFNTYFKG